MTLRRIIVSLVLLIGLPLLGIPAGFALLDAWKGWDAGSWQELGTPPKKPTSIVNADLDEVYVRAQDGSLWVCDHTGPTRDNACWRETEEVGKLASGEEHNQYYRQEIPPPPGTAKQVLHISWYHAERARHSRYALLEDGSVWLWDCFPDANWSLVLLACGPISGLALAVIIVSLWWGVAGLRALWRRVQTKTES
jgi:hypothetical protein